MTLKDYLDAKGETAQAFAARAGLSIASMSRILAGTQEPRRALRERIVAATGGAVGHADLIGGADPAGPAGPPADEAGDAA